MKCNTKPANLFKTANSSDDQYPKLYFYRRLVHAKLFIDQHYAENIDLFNIAGEACYSRFHFIRKFSEIYHQTPHQYLIFVRIEHAQALLTSGLSVAEVCQAVGFEELSSFSRLFKRRVGVNPSVFLLRQQAIKKQIREAPLTVIPHCFAYQYGWLTKEQFQTSES